MTTQNSDTQNTVNEAPVKGVGTGEMVRAFIIQEREALERSVTVFYDDPDHQEFATLNEAMSELDADNDQNDRHYEIYAHRIIERVEKVHHYLCPNKVI